VTPFNLEHCDWYPQIIFYVKQYFDDFNNAFKKYYNKLKTDNTGYTLKNFEDALKSINSSLIPVLGSSLRSQASGGSSFTINPI
jgi:hypothetical protein